MKNTCSLQQICQTGDVDSNLKTRQYKFDSMARFMTKKSIKTETKQFEIAKELGCSSSSLQRYRHDIKMLSPYRIPPDSHKRKQKIS